MGHSGRASGITVPRRLSDTGWLQPGTRRRGSRTSEGSNGSLTCTCAVYGDRVSLTGTADAFFGIRADEVHDISCSTKVSTDKLV